MSHYYRDRRLRCRRCTRLLIAPLFDVTLLAAMCPDCSMADDESLWPVFNLAVAAN
jgi:hypothetical protein